MPEFTCSAVRSFIMSNHTQVWVPCYRTEHHDGEHRARNPEAGLRLKWRDGFVHAARLRRAD